MKIIIISCAAPPEPIVAGRVHWDIATSLAENNDQVWLLSPFPSRPLSKRYEVLKENKISQIQGNFYHVCLNSFRYPKYNLFFRLYESFDFGIKAIKYVNKSIKDYDLIYASPWPFIGQLMILILRKDRTKSIIMNVQDLYPESFFNKIRLKFLRKLFSPLKLIDKYIANKSTHITVVSESLKDVYVKNRKINCNKLTVIKNWQDESEFIKPVPSMEVIIDKFNLNQVKNKFLFMYLGNIGPVAGVEKLIYAFADLKNQSSALVIAGSGSHKDKCIKVAKDLNISNIHFVEVPSGLAPVVELQSISDVLLLPIQPNAANSSIPSKLIAYMFSGKPIISSADKSSETADAILESGCGWATESNEVYDWNIAMRNALEIEKSELNQVGRYGYDFALNNYSKSNGLKKVNDLLTNFKKQKS